MWSPGELVADLDFEKPFNAHNGITFGLTVMPRGTEVPWQMAGVNSWLLALLGKVWSMDKMVGKDFEKGLAELNAAAEGGR